MPTDGEKLSPKAQMIFKSLEPFFPPDPWKKPRWEAEGRVFDNGWFDLRKRADRTRLAENQKSFLGYLVEMEAIHQKTLTGSLEGFTKMHFTRVMQMCAEIVILLNDLDFQIETGDVVDECEK